MSRIWDYQSPKQSSIAGNSAGRNVMKEWAIDAKLSVRERAQLNAKLDILQQLGFDAAVSHRLVAGTSGDFNHIYKLIVHSTRMLRPMLCRGPIDPFGEITLLCGAIEKDWKLHRKSSAAPEKLANERRISLELALAKGEQERVAHERF